jgi:transcription antitermination factor NusG
MFKGYLFVEIETALQRDYVQSCYFLSGLLGEASEAGFKPREIPTRYVVDLIEHGPLEIGKAKSRAQYRKGQKVKVAISSLNEIFAEVDSIDKKGKIVIFADLLGGQRVIHVDPKQIELVE